MIGLFTELPRTARIWKHILGAEVEWDHQEHLLADIRDIANYVAYFSMISAGSGVKQSAWKEIIKDAPKPGPRPGEVVEKEVVRISTPDEMAQFFGAVGKPTGRKK